MGSTLISGITVYPKKSINQKIMKKSYLNILLLFVFFPVAQVNSQSMEKKLDDIFLNEYPAGDPGAIVLIAKDGKAIYRKAFGSANLELDVPLKPEHVMELGSLTKQFTAGAILMLMEEGKLSLQDPLSKYIPDYPNGEKITLHHLLNHTSGVKNFTSIPGFQSLLTKDMTPSEIITFFRDEPLDFTPGENYQYSNSGYILLGHIIEKVSEMTYEDFIETKIFKPLGMKSSRYGSKKEVIPNRASGYKPDPTGAGNINALGGSMTIPYASGALMSTVDDMLLWNQAWRNNTLISEKSKQLAFKATTLNNGKTSYYGYGWGVSKLYGIPTVEHSGRISGYFSFGIYLPEKNIYTIILTNNDGQSPVNIALDATATVLGKPISTSKNSVSLPENSLKQWTGAYAFEDGAIRYITYNDGSLYSRREDGEAIQLHAVSEKEFRFDNSFVTTTFGMENGKKVAVFSGRNDIIKGEETDAPPAPAAPAERKIITVDPSVLESYSGIYKGKSGFVMKISSKEGRIYAHPGEMPLEIFAETPEIFSPEEYPVKITFNKDSQGNVKSLTMEQKGKKMEAVKVE